jgi:hypothetical protein
LGGVLFDAFGGFEGGEVGGHFDFGPVEEVGDGEELDAGEVAAGEGGMGKIYARGGIDLL